MRLYLFIVSLSGHLRDLKTLTSLRDTSIALDFHGGLMLQGELAAAEYVHASLRRSNVFTDANVVTVAPN